jgi:hypothetical protein
MRSALALALGTALACEAPPPAAPADAAAASVVTPSASASQAAPPVASSATSESAQPLDAAAPEAPLPNVKVVNIGMHVGGGPNDPATKDPIAKSVEPRFDDFRRCFARVFDPKRGGDFGVDLLVPAAGGAAKVSHPRTSLKGERFEECVVGIFESIEFQKPRFGLTTVSYSLRFAPGA